MPTSENLRLRNSILPQALATTVKHRTLMAVVLICFPTLKEINTRRGYETGDWALDQATRKISEFARTDECLFRINGAKLVLILPSLENEAIMEMVLARITDRLSTPYEIGTTSLFMPPKIGAGYTDGLNVGSEDLLCATETALNTARKSSRNWQAEKAIPASQDPLRDFQSELKNAIEQDKLTLLFQPQVDLRTGKCVGFEALTRWQHLNTFISPDIFIPYAERSELIHQITNWTLHNALRQLKELEAQCPDGSTLRVSLNISGRCLENDLLPRSIKNALGIWGIEPERLILELTETAFIEDLKSAAHACNQLKQELGVGISLDDFGLGYSGLEILQHVDANELKIDRRFVSHVCTDERSLRIVKGLVLIAKSLGMRVVAEGIETEEIVTVLHQMSAQIGQGYLFSKPLADHEAVAWLDENRHKCNV